MKTRISKKGDFKVHTLEGKIKSIDSEKNKVLIAPKEGETEEIKFNLPEELVGHRVFYAQHDSRKTKEWHTGRWVWDNDGPEGIYAFEEIERKECYLIVLEGNMEGTIYKYCAEECVRKGEY